MLAKATEVDKFFDSDVIKSATEPEKLQQFRRTLAELIRGIKGGAWALSTQPQSPQGLAAVIAVVAVDDAPLWIDGVRSAAGLLGEDFFVNKSANRYCQSVNYLSNADTITNVPIHHLVLDLIDHSGDAPRKKVNFGAAFGPSKKIIQIAALDDQKVAICVGDHPRVMAALIASARGQAPTLDGSAGAAEVKRLLPESCNMFMLFSPAELIRLGRTLARVQDKVEEFSYRTPTVSAPIGATLTGTKSGCRIDAVIPLDLAASLKALFFEASREPGAIEPPSTGN